MDVLGASGTYPARGRPCSGYLVTTGGGARILVDAGPGTFGALAERIDPAELDGVVVSHAHADHVVDVFALYHYGSYRPGGFARIPLWCTEDTAAMIEHFARVNGPDHRFHRVFDVRYGVSGVTTKLRDASLRFAAAHHTVPALITRIDSAGANLVYSGDTGMCDGLAQLAAAGGTLLCEASLQGPALEKDFEFHLTAVEAGLVAAAAHSDRLVLTHLPPHLDASQSVREASAVYDGPIDVAEPGMVITV